VSRLPTRTEVKIVFIRRILSEGTGYRDQAAEHQASIAVREFLLGNPAEARRAVTAALALVPGIGMPRQPQPCDLDRRFPESTFPQFRHLPFQRAQLALNRRDRQEPSKSHSRPRHVFNDPTIAVAARLQLAGALLLSGDRRKAKSAYDNFLSLWEDADADIPILQQAKAERATLQ
jgi:hypothetical protein